MKSKYLIQKVEFYLQLILLFIHITLLTFWVVEIVFLGTNKFDNSSQQEQDFGYQNFLTTKLFVFIGSYLVIVFFLVNLLVSRRYGIGYFFCIIWFIFFLSILITHLIDKNAYENTFRKVVFSLFVVVNVFQLLLILYWIFKVNKERMINKISMR
ncbi:unknown; predicted coding region [Mycoplasmopsis pulmonis]|uniref:Uncharacterized protein n=1 Tax=Mycoplasmopsis pulmonis (strain UAB CTIP) TaxID=272635 RepID=Q98PT1_MYCPU|nr:hypothetical protein [Mycoplasmopsis pulmonis]CAC13811.1 unknown; predicted coding region [Mycoplasmopsis pulmonis]VEU68401.1 Uncharacterised protein [Mycoplasmopsis pulmonis]